MTLPDVLFYALHIPAFAGWAMLLFAPRAEMTGAWVHSGRLVVILAAIYLVLLFCGTVLGMAAPGAGMTSLGAIGALFSHPVGLLTGWAHFLAFDLFAGAWIARDAGRDGISHRATLPWLVLTLVFGPLGLGGYLMWRTRGRGAVSG